MALRKRSGQPTEVGSFSAFIFSIAAALGRVQEIACEVGAVISGNQALTAQGVFQAASMKAMRGIAVISFWHCCAALRSSLRPALRAGRTAIYARRPKTADEWREWRRKESVSARKTPADDELARRAQRWAEAVGADASTLDGLPLERRRQFLDEFERDLPKNDPAPRNAPVEDASEINVDWERRVQFDALRDGNALRQNDVLNKAIRRES